MRRIFKELFLCISIGILSVIGFCFVGELYVANENVVMVNILVWTGVVMVAYISMIFIPIWKKKNKYFIDLLAFSSGYLGITVCCLFRTKDIDEYNFLSTMEYVSGFLALIALVYETHDKTNNIIMEKRISSFFVEKTRDLQDDMRVDLLRLVVSFKEHCSFTESDAKMVLNKSKRRLKNVLNEGTKRGVIKVINASSSNKTYEIAIDKQDN